MSNPLATPSFISGAKDTLATADVYTLNNNTPITDVAAITAATNPTIANSLRGGKSMSSTASSLAATAVSAASALLSAATLTARVASSMPEMGSVLSQLSSSAASSIINGITSNSGITATVNGLTKTLVGTAFGDIAAIGAMINGNACHDSFSIDDPGAIAEVTSGYLKIAMGSGIPNSFSALTCGISDKGILTNIAGNVLPNAVQSSDLQSITAIANSVGGGTLLSLNPNVLNNISSNFNNGPNATTADLLSNSANITSTYAAVNPNWNVYNSPVNGVGGDITALQDGSPDLQNSLSCSAMSSAPALPSTDFTVPVDAATPDQLALLGAAYPSSSTDVNTLLGNQFPNTAPVSGNINVSGSTDPTIMQYTSTTTSISDNGSATTVVNGTLVTAPPVPLTTTSTNNGTPDVSTPMITSSLCMTEPLSSANVSAPPPRTLSNGDIETIVYYTFSDGSTVVSATVVLAGTNISVGPQLMYADVYDNNIKTTGSISPPPAGPSQTSSNLPQTA